MRRVDSRCAMAMVVRPWMSRSSASWIISSVSESTEEVASSRIMIRGSISTARAIDSRCRSPPDRPWPRVPMRVS